MKKPNLTGDEVQQVHAIFTNMQVLADALYELISDLDDSPVGPWLMEETVGSPYCVQQVQRLWSVTDEIWYLRLALAWDLFPARRQAALHFCRQTLKDALNAHAARMTNEAMDGLADLLRRLGKAHVFLLQEPLTTEMFVEGVAALAQVVRVLLTIEKDPWKTETHFYQQLYRTLMKILYRGQETSFYPEEPFLLKQVLAWFQNQEYTLVDCGESSFLCSRREQTWVVEVGGDPYPPEDALPTFQQTMGRLLLKYDDAYRNSSFGLAFPDEHCYVSCCTQFSKELRRSLHMHFFFVQPDGLVRTDPPETQV